jgi:stage V sporulation protein D (sporulation-specific penicillin-binding protein)
MAVQAPHPPLIRRRIEMFFFLIALCYIALMGRIVYLQAVYGDHYREKAKDLRERTIQLPASWGAITDRDGRPLAVTTHKGVLVCDPTMVEDPEKTAQAAAAIFGGTPADYRDALKKRQVTDPKSGRTQNIRWAALKHGLTMEQMEMFRKLRDDKKKGKALEGLFIQDMPERTYPMGWEAMHVIGYMVQGDDGKMRGGMGLEASLNKELRGRDGEVQAEVDGRGRIIPDTRQHMRAVEDGLDVKLTLDSSIQHIAASELAAVCEKYKPVGATAIVLDVKTGDVLAMVSYPGFDPLKRSELKGDIKPMLLNRAITRYEPGSTLKIISVCGALEDKTITQNTRFFCGGKLQIGKRHISCVLHGPEERHGHGWETPDEIIAKSCNVSTAQIGKLMGVEGLERHLDRFGLLEKTGVKLPNDMAGTLGFGAEKYRGGVGKAARVAFGQSVMVTPLALASAYAAIANNGKRMHPRLVMAYTDSDGKVIQEFPPKEAGVAMDPQATTQARNYLELVVLKGTGKKDARIPGYTAAGKTGTAQKVVENQKGYARGKYVASFFGYVPAKNPRVVICVVVDEPQGGEYYGSQVAAPAFREIGKRVMWYLKVPPDDPATLHLQEAKSRLP